MRGRGTDGDEGNETETHVCDICGEERMKENLIQLSADSPESSVDVCSDCQSRPISDLIAVVGRGCTAW
jgi:DNA-directed RNA polymerase subunit M/transcription elongation factor TFIIS